jgi:hypothetical protein
MIHYPHLLAFKTAQPVADAIADLARRDCLTVPEVCRRLILAGLRENGMDPASLERSEAA